MKRNHCPQNQLPSENLHDQQLAVFAQIELEFERGRIEALADYLVKLEPDEIAHQHWLAINRIAVRKARFVVGKGLVID
jgi:hypothetical protein